jgi:uncharacterized protein YggE
MPVRLTSTQRALLAGAAAAGVLIGAFAAGAALGGGNPAAAATAPGHTLAIQTADQAAGAGGARITVTGTGAISGTPDQLMLSMCVQTSDSSVSAALQRANQAVRAVIGALARTGVRRSDIQTSGLSIQPNYAGNSALPTGYGVSESIDVTLRRLATAGTQISDAVRAGGNATVVDGVSLNLSDTSSLLAAARARAVADARTKAAQYAKALGRSVGPVVSVSEQGGVEPPPMLMAGAARSSTPSPVPVSPGRQRVTVRVTAVFALA